MERVEGSEESRKKSLRPFTLACVQAFMIDNVHERPSVTGENTALGWFLATGKNKLVIKKKT